MVKVSFQNISATIVMMFGYVLVSLSLAGDSSITAAASSSKVITSPFGSWFSLASTETETRGGESNDDSDSDKEDSDNSDDEEEGSDGDSDSSDGQEETEENSEQASTQSGQASTKSYMSYQMIMDSVQLVQGVAGSTVKILTNGLLMPNGYEASVVDEYLSFLI